jgi:hypothetical protein
MAHLSVSIPTSIGTISFPIPEDYPVPPVGGDFYYNFEPAMTDPEEWEVLQSMLENNVLTVDRIGHERIFLHEGVRASHPVIDPEDYMPAYERYWEQNPETRPPF